MKNTKTKTLDCKICGNEVKNVGHDAVKVTCYVCVNKSMLTGISLDEDMDIKQDENND